MIKTYNAPHEKNPQNLSHRRVYVHDGFPSQVII